MSPRRRRSPKTDIELTRRALADLREIELYAVGERGRKTADSDLDDIAAAIDRLSEKPGILRLEPDLSPGLYFYRVRKHFLVCDFHGDTVIVLTLIHTSMDLPAGLLELEPRLVAESQMLQARLQRKSEKS